MNALDRQARGADDNSAQANHLVVANTLKGQRGKAGGGIGPEETLVAIGTGVAEHGAAVRRLTPIECERLQGWPDNWTAPPGVKAPDSRRYAAAGDGVCANVAEWVGRGILAEDAAS